MNRKKKWNEIKQPRKKQTSWSVWHRGTKEEWIIKKEKEKPKWQQKKLKKLEEKGESDKEFES